MTSLRRLLMTNDLVESIEGVLSGSIEFMLTSMQAGSKFSEAVIEAQRRG
jgi:homoserine dehydrogenase